MRTLKPVAIICFGLTTALAAAAAAQDTRPSDLSKLPPQEVNPRPLMGAEAPSAPMTSAQALDTLRFHGYLNISGLKQDAQGNWWAEAQKQFDGPTMSLELKRNGDVLEQPAAQNSASHGQEGAPGADAQSQSGSSPAQPRS
jgi:hypothetical protein